MKESNSDFNFWIPAQIEKAKDKQGNEVMRVKGIASTDDRDSEDEVLLPIGFDLRRFINYGQINWNHQGKNDPAKIIGEPDVAKITPDGKLYIEGILYPTSDLAKSVWNYGQTLEKDSKTRRLGWSIEGRAIERDLMNPKKITKALITGVAITPTPVNVNTYVDLVKGMQKEDYIDYEYEQDSILQKAETDSIYLYEFSADGKQFGITKSFNVEELSKESRQREDKIKKVMNEFKAGTLKTSNGDLVTDRRQAIAIAMSEAEILEEKSMDVAATAPLVPESLDKKPKVLEPTIKKAILMGLMTIDQIEKAIK